MNAASCCGIFPCLFGTCLAGSIGNGAGPFPGSWMVGSSEYANFAPINIGVLCAETNISGGGRGTLADPEYVCAVAQQFELIERKSQMHGEFFLELMHCYKQSDFLGCVGHFLGISTGKGGIRFR